jgi:uncharacterized protein YlxW (UPF0749 family)
MSQQSPSTQDVDHEPRVDSARGLLDLLAQNAMDQDYAETAIRRSRVGTEPRERKSRKMTSLALALALFCLALLVATSSMQRFRQTDEVANSRKELANQVKVAKARLQENSARIETLTIEIEQLQAARLSNDKDAQELLRETNQLKAQAGYAEVSGPGIQVIIDDAEHATDTAEEVLDRDLQRTANGLFEAGAEAVSINGQRLASLTSIRTAGHSIGVNYRPLEGPYVLSAIGNPKTLSNRFSQTEGALYMLAVKKRYGLRFEVKSVKTMTLPAAPMPKLLFSKPDKSNDNRGDGA